MAATTTAFETELLQRSTTFYEPTNFVTNPSFETDANAWGQVAGSGVATRLLTGGVAGFACLRQVNPGTVIAEGPRTNSFDVSANQTYSAGIYVKGALGGENLRFTLKERDAADVAINETLVPVVCSTDWQYVVVTRAFGPLGVKARIAVQSPAAGVASTFFVDGAVIVTGQPVAYFDGTFLNCQWLGTPHASATTGAVVTFNTDSKGRGLMGGAAYKLRQAYLQGVTDPLAHTLAKANPKQLKALNDYGKLASFDAITAP